MNFKYIGMMLFAVCAGVATILFYDGPDKNTFFVGWALVFHIYFAAWWVKLDKDSPND